MFGRERRTVLDIGIRRVTERGIERSDGALVTGLALAPIDLESLDSGQVDSLNAAMAGFLAGLDEPVQLLISNNRFDCDHHLAHTIARWRGDWSAKTGLRERAVADGSGADGWSAVVGNAARDSNLRRINVRLMLSSAAAKGRNPSDPGARIERLGAGLAQAGIAWRALGGLELVLELERAFLHGGGALENALAAGGPVRLVEGLENLAFDLADPLPDWIEFGPRHMRFPNADGDRFCAAGYLRALPRAVSPAGWPCRPGSIST